MSEKWYENDGFLSSVDMHAPSSSFRFTGLETKQVADFDHRCKIIQWNVPGQKRGRWTPPEPGSPEAAQQATINSNAEKPKAKLRWDTTRGASGKDTLEEYKTEIEEEMKKHKDKGEKTEEWEWDKWAELIVNSAEKIVGRKPKGRDIMCLPAHREELEKQTLDLKHSYSAMKSAPKGSQIYWKMKEEHRTMQWQNRQELRRSRHALINELAVKVEFAMKDNNTSQMFALTRVLNIWAGSTFSFKETDQVTASQHKECISKIAGAENSSYNPAVLEAVVNRPLSSGIGEAPNNEEILDNIKAMKESAAGADEVTIGMIRALPDVGQVQVFRLIQQMWQEPHNERLWTGNIHSSLLVMLFKKGCRSDPQNYRAISLLCVLSRILARIAGARLAIWAEDQKLLPETQWGFRKGRSTRDIIMIVRIIFEQFASAESRLCAKIKLQKRKCKKKGEEFILTGYPEIEKLQKQIDTSRPLLTAVDIKKAYPTTARKLLWDSLRKMGCDERLVCLLKTLHEDTRYTVRCSNTISDPFLLKRGVREGCPSSPVLYNLFHAAPQNEMQEQLSGMILLASEEYFPERHPVANNQCHTPWSLSMLGFADDTNSLSTIEEGRKSEQVMSQALQRHGS